MHSKVRVPGCLDGEFVIIGAKGSDEVISVRLCAVSHAEVVDNQAEGNIESLVLKEAGSVGALVVAMFSKMRDEAKLTETTSLRESIHAFAYLEVDSIVVEERLEIVGSDRFSW